MISLIVIVVFCFSVCFSILVLFVLGDLCICLCVSMITL